MTPPASHDGGIRSAGRLGRAATGGRSGAVMVWVCRNQQPLTPHTATAPIPLAELERAGAEGHELRRLNDGQLGE